MQEPTAAKNVAAAKNVIAAAPKKKVQSSDSSSETSSEEEEVRFSSFHLPRGMLEQVNCFVLLLNADKVVVD